MTWDNFLRRMADDYSLSPEQTQVFVARFSEENKNKSENEIEEDLTQYLRIINLDCHAYRKRRGGIYDKFTQNKQNPHGCREINHKGPHKAKKLLAWLESKYQEEFPQSPRLSTLELTYPDNSLPLNSPGYIHPPEMKPTQPKPELTPIVATQLTLPVRRYPKVKRTP